LPKGKEKKSARLSFTDTLVGKEQRYALPNPRKVEKTPADFQEKGNWQKA